MVTALTLDAIRLRKDAALKRRGALTAEIAGLDQEIEDCEASERLFTRINGSEQLPPSDLYLFNAVSDSQALAASPAIADDLNPYRAETTKHYIWQCLRNSQNRWLTAVEIRSIASVAKKDAIPMSSISPMINAMMKQGHVVRDGLKVALKERIESKNPATEAAGS